MFEKLTKAKKLEKAKKIWMDAAAEDRAWQKEAREDFAFRDGFQWNKEEKELLDREMRPALTFNLTKSQIDLVMGMNEDNRIRYRSSPVDKNDGFLCEVMNTIMDWVYEVNDFDDEEDATLESAATCGRAFAAVDFMPNPNKFGEIDLTTIMVPVHEVHVDPNSRRPLFMDASHISWDRWMNAEDVLMRYPKISKTKLKTMIETGKTWGLDGAEAISPSDVFTEVMDVESDEFNDYDKELDINFYNRSKNQLRIVHMEYWDTYKRYYAPDPQTGEWVEFDGKQLKQIKTDYELEFNRPFVYETITDKKVKWLQFTGDEILYDDDSPLPYPGFSIVGMYAFRDASLRTANHYGIVRLIKDPQREVNKRWSQSLHMLNQQVQTGVFAETEAFVDQRQAELSLKEPGAITWLNPGALARIREREMPTFPNAPMQLEEASQSVMKKITGINPDLLGQDRGRQEPGVVVRLRQQQGITLLRPLFKSLNRAKKEIFKRLLAIVMEYMPDQQILRILGSGDRYQIDKQTGIIVDKVTGNQANIRDIRNVEYNIRAEEAPGNLTKRMLELQTYLDMQQAGIQVDPRVIIEKTELPETAKQRWLEWIDSNEQSQMQMAQEQIDQEAEFKERELEVKEQKNLIDLLLGVAKMDTQATKDDKKLLTDFQALSNERQRDIANTFTNMAQVLVQAETAKDQARAKAEGGTKDGGGKKTKPV